MVPCASSASTRATSSGRAEEFAMARIAGVDIPREKRLEISLTYIYGVGKTTAQQVADGTNISRDTRVRDLTDEEVSRLRAYIDQNLKVEGDLRRQVSQDIKRKMEIGCY